MNNTTRASSGPPRGDSLLALMAGIDDDHSAREPWLAATASGTGTVYLLLFARRADGRGGSGVGFVAYPIELAGRALSLA